MKVQQLGEFIRKQRHGAKISLQALSQVAGVSKPYLSQIERGLRKPSAEILQAIAKGLRISAQTLYVQAGILEHDTKSDVHTAITGDRSLTERQRQVLIQVYESFREETSHRREQRRTVVAGKKIATTDKVEAVAKAATTGTKLPRSANGDVPPRASVRNGREGGDAG